LRCPDGFHSQAYYRLLSIFQPFFLYFWFEVPGIIPCLFEETPVKDSENFQSFFQLEILIANCSNCHSVLTFTFTGKVGLLRTLRVMELISNLRRRNRLNMQHVGECGMLSRCYKKRFYRNRNVGKVAVRYDHCHYLRRLLLSWSFLRPFRATKRQISFPWSKWCYWWSSSRLTLHVVDVKTTCRTPRTNA